MAGEATLSIDAVGLDEWDRFIKSLIASGKNGSKFLEAIFNTRGFRDIVDHFKQEEGPDGAWQKRSRYTDAYYDNVSQGKADPFPGTSRGSYSSSNKLLQLTGRLRQSLARPGGNVKEMGRDAIMIFSNIEYSGKHDRGETASRLPKREFMWLSDKAQEDMGGMLLNMIMDEAG